MAQKVQVQLLDDLDGTDADETVTFALDGAQYEIDLNAKNAGNLRKALDKYVGAARRAGRPAATGKARAGGKAERDYDLDALRTWAAANGHEVPARGRIKQTVIDAYKASGGK